MVSAKDYPNVAPRKMDHCPLALKQVTLYSRACVFRRDRVNYVISDNSIFLSLLFCIVCVFFSWSSLEKEEEKLERVEKARRREERSRRVERRRPSRVPAVPVYSSPLVVSTDL